jgi:hypothetical protein
MAFRASLVHSGPVPLCLGKNSSDSILQSLFAMHQRGVIHGNPLWDNVVEVDDGSFRWINFGLCPLVVGDRQELAKTIRDK